MKNKRRFFLMGLMVTIVMSAMAQTRESRNNLFHTNENIERLKQHISSDDFMRQNWEFHLQKAEELVARDRIYPPDLHDLSLAYRMTGDVRFAEKIRDLLLDFSQRETWEGSILLNRTPPWRSGLGTAHTSFRMALGYDAIYDFLKPSERKMIAEGFVRVAIQPTLEDWLSVDKSIHTFDTMGHNWWSASVFKAGILSLAIRDEVPEALTWVREVAHTITEWISYTGSILQNKPSNFDREGGFYESVNYAAYGFSQYLLFRYAHQNALPGDVQPEVPMMEKMGDFFLQTNYYTSENMPYSLNFGDTRKERNGHAVIVLLYNMGLQKESYAWFLKKCDHGYDRENLDVETPLGMLLRPVLPEVAGLPDLPKAMVYSDMGWAIMRNSWENDATLLAVKSGFTWNHAHADAGSFILWHNGRNLIIDSGNTSYGHPEYTEYYCQSEAHNVVLWNGKGQEPKDQYFGVPIDGSLHEMVHTDDFKYIYANNTGPTARWFSRNFRHFLWIEDVILVIDDLETYEPGVFEWLLHYNGESRRRGQDLPIRDGDAEVVVRPLFPNTFPDTGLPHDFPENMRLKERMGLKTHDRETEEPYWSVYHADITNKTKFITAIILKNENNQNNLPVIERVEEIDMMGVRITQGGKVTEVYLNLLADGRIKHRNSINEMNGWDTDALITALTFSEGTDRTNPDNIERTFIAHGSYLRRDGKPLYHSLGKVFMLAERNGRQLDMQISGQPQGNASFYMPSRTSNIVLNGSSHNVDFDSKSNLIRFNIPGDIYIK